MTDDEHLMLQVAEGDMDAFGELVLRHQRAAWSVACRFLSDAQQAEDIVQQAFLKILDAAARYKPTAKFRTYLHSVVWRLCIDRYRKKKPVQAATSLDHYQADQIAPHDAVQQTETAARVRAAIDALPARQRMAVLLKHFDGLSYNEIAEAMDCTPRAVDSLLSRARAQLKDLLAD